MTDKPNRFRIRRADKEEDNKLVTPEDMLLLALEDLRSGEVPMEKVLILYEYPNDDGTSRAGYYAANLTRPDHLATLEIARWRLLNDWLE